MKDERDLRWAVYTAAYDVLRDYDNHPDKDRGLIQAGDQRLPNLIADGVVARYEALRRQPSVEEVARVIHNRVGTGNSLGLTYADSMPAARDLARQIAQLYKGEGG